MGGRGWGEKDRAGDSRQGRACCRSAPLAAVHAPVDRPGWGGWGQQERTSQGLVAGRANNAAHQRRLQLCVLLRGRAGWGGARLSQAARKVGGSEVKFQGGEVGFAMQAGD